MRCQYCMPEENYVWLPRQSILTFEELSRLARIFGVLGASKVRITGGEPLLRHELHRLVSQVRAIPEIEDIALTTNGLLLARHAGELKTAGLDRITVSLDTLRPDRMEQFSRTPHHADLFLDVRVPPTKSMAVARREVLDMVRGLAERFPDFGIEGEVYVTAPGAEIEEGHELVGAIDGAHEEVFGEVPGRDVTRWFSDASVLTRYGIPTVNYGTSTGLMDVELGENLEIDGLVRTAEVYARVAMRVCAAG